MVGVIIQARIGSSRLPGKTMKKICGEPLLYYSVQRALQSKYVDKVIVATSNEVQDDSIKKWCDYNNISSYRGSEQDVLDRYFQCAKENNLDVIVRATADNPFIDPEIIDLLVLTLKTHKLDYVTMRHETNTWPYGLDVEVFNMTTLEKVWKLSKIPEHREHVTMYIKDNRTDFKVKEVINNYDLSQVRLTVDYEQDFIRASRLMDKLKTQFGLQFFWTDVVDKYNLIEKENFNE